MNGWTEQMDAELTKHVNAGLSFSQAAGLINADFGLTLSRNAAIGRAHRLGMKGSAIGESRNKTPRSKAPPKPRAVRRHRIVEAFEVEQPEMRCVEVAPLGVDLMDLNDAVCRYPSEDAPFTFCGHPVRDGSPYCGPHHGLCHNQARATRRDDAAHPGQKRSVRFFNYEAA